MGRLIDEIRYSVRTLRRTPGYATAAVLTLALSIGAMTAIYTVLKSVVLDPLPYPHPERLVRITNPVPGVEPDAVWQLSPAQYVYFGENARSLDEIGMYHTDGGNLGTPDGVIRVSSVVATASVLRLLGARAVHGRLFIDRDDTPEAPAVGVLSHSFWQRQFGGDTAVIGSVLQLNSEPVEVIGVMAPGTEIPERGGGIVRLATEIWLPYRLDPTSPSWFGSHIRPGIARLASDAPLESAQSEIDQLTPGLRDAHPSVYSPGFFDRTGMHTTLLPLKDDVVGDSARNLWMLLGAVGVVLLIAAANVANLFLVRIESRRHELSVRSALGASRGMVATHYLAESLVLALAGGGIALFLGYIGVDWLVSSAPAIPRLDAIRLDAGVFAFALAVSLVVAVGLTAVAALRSGHVNGVAVLVEAGRRTTTVRERQRLRSALVVSQVALALILVVGAGLLLESFRRLHAIDPGIDPNGVLVMEVFLPPDPYENDEVRWHFYGPMLERVRALPGVTAAGLGAVPLGGGGNYGCSSQIFEDRQVYARLEDRGLTTCAGQNAASPGYFEALGIPLISGRLLTARDHDNPATGAVVVSRAFSQRFWPGEDPIGKGVRPDGSGREHFHRVVGVVGDVYGQSVEDEPAMAIYYPMVPVPQNAGVGTGLMRLVVRTDLPNSTSLFPAIRAAVAEVDPTIPLANLQEMQTIVDRSMSRQAFTLVLLGLAATVALALAAIGLYGVISYVVARRTGEIGIRIALGAQGGQVQRLVVVGSLKLVLVGLLGGLVAALLMTRLLRGMLFEIAPTHPAAYIGAATLLTGVAVFASWLPARRAARVDPAEALRTE